ncbi:hypothetical protein SYNTR_2294 [Candidatus Syntrophocurvum alkaliphilum]|uniref:Accessory gene regulator B n=1 Tax=Candidatus Syntrophocurvum alkaliphilum TaxID=2293317 RepID=A0A6I6DQC5_9FIRM|nr:accessory gene regulator B family protein [Candidatus Syntrophocurvum alkaliphilum]QGU00888.1 hypothetical protein SYNTR_2294 [Candidatus Syntrophocurvum alkaliphilum]
MLSKISHKIANQISHELNENDEKIEIYAYGLELLIGSILQLIILFLLAWIFSLFHQTLVAIIAFASIRILCGGIHMSSYLRCLSCGLLIILFFAKISTMQYSVYTFVLLILITFVLGIVSIIKWIPSYTEQKQHINNSNAKKIKSISLFMLLVWMGLSIIFYHKGIYDYSLAIILGVLGGVFLATPLGHTIFGKLDDSLVALSKRRC